MTNTPKKISKRTLDGMLAKLTTEEGKSSLILAMSYTATLPRQAIEDTVREYMNQEELQKADILLSNAGKTGFPELCQELSDRYLPENCEKAAELATVAGNTEQADQIYTSLCEQAAQKGRWIYAASCASRAGDFLKETELYISWARDVRDKISAAEEKGSEGYEDAAHIAQKKLHDLENQVDLPEKVKKGLKDELQKAVIRNGAHTALKKRADYTFHERLDELCEKAKEYGKTDLLIHIFEDKKDYFTAAYVSRKVGDEKRAELYEKMR